MRNDTSKKSPQLTLVAIGTGVLLAACAGMQAGDRNAAAVNAIDTLVVIYAENRAFDTMYGLFPGANGIPGVNPERGRDLRAAERLRRCRAADAAAGVGRPHRQRPARDADAGTKRRHGQQAVSHRRPGGPERQRRGRAAVDHHARPGAPLLQQRHADRRRQQRPLRRLFRCRRAGDGLLRRQQHAALEDRPAVHAGRQLLHGRVRRLVPEPPVSDLRLRARWCPTSTTRRARARSARSRSTRKAASCV